MKVGRMRAIGLGCLLLGAPGLVRAAPGPGAEAPASASEGATAGSVMETRGGSSAQASASEGARAGSVMETRGGSSAQAGASEGASAGPVMETRGGSSAQAGGSEEARAGPGDGSEEARAEPTGESAPAGERAASKRGRTWQIYQRPLPGAEHSWGPPNGQMPAVAEFTEAPPDPHRAPPTGIARIAVGAALGTVGLGVLGLGIAARTTDVLGADRRAGVPLIGAGLVTAAIGWGLFAHGILRRGAYLRWRAAQATIAPGIGGATLVLRF